MKIQIDRDALVIALNALSSYYDALGEYNEMKAIDAHCKLIEDNPNYKETDFIITDERCEVKCN